MLFMLFTLLSYYYVRKADNQFANYSKLTFSTNWFTSVTWQLSSLAPISAQTSTKPNVARADTKIGFRPTPPTPSHSTHSTPPPQTFLHCLNHLMLNLSHWNLAGSYILWPKQILQSYEPIGHSLTDSLMTDWLTYLFSFSCQNWA